MNQKKAKFNANNVGVGVLGDPHIEGKTQKGITLIALVITIIVLLILAGVTINMVLGDDGIIQNAQKAKQANEESADREAVELAKGEAKLANHIKQTPMSDADLNKALGKTGENVIENNKTVAKVVDGVPIPLGFSYVQGTTKDEGLIVVDGYGNEFVWVPVDEVLESGSVNYEDDEVWLIHNEYDTILVEDDEANDLNATEFANDYEEMKTSVSTYGGFYVGRYETSWTGSRVASVGNVTAMNGNTIIGESGANWYTFYNKQKELYNKETDSVVSGMIYGSQWDAIMDWMSDVVNPYAVDPDNNLYINDSTGMGHFCYSANVGLIVEEIGPIETGSNPNFAVKNIYDLAGNFMEATTKSNSMGDVVAALGWHYERRG